MDELEKATILKKLKDDPCYEDARDYGEGKCHESSCDETAAGVLYYWCGDSQCCHPPVAFYCEDHLIKKFGDGLEERLT